MALRPRSPLAKKPAGAPIPIKRVIRRDGHFICGMCRRPRATEGEAVACLEACLARWLGGAPPINEVKGGEGKQFRCGFCKRVYTRRDEAQACADACRRKAKQDVEAERTVSPARAAAGAAAPVAARAPAPADEEKTRKLKAPKFGREHMHKFLRDGRKLICRKCGKESATLEAVIACYDADVKAPKPKVERVAKPAEPAFAAAEAKPAAPEPAPEAAPAAKAKKSLDGVDDATMFFRDGARYVCRTCNARFFTRGDVIACFSAH